VDLGLNLRKGKRDCGWVAVLCERIDPWTAWVAKAEEFCDFIVGFASRVIDCTAHERIAPRAALGTGEIEMRVSAGNYQCQRWFFGFSWLAVVECFALFALIEEDGVNVAFKVIDRNERDILCVGEGFGIGDANEQCSGQTGTGCNGDGVDL
jgi:hypothetical protein